jgi:hypothetical protein
MLTDELGVAVMIAGAAVVAAGWVWLLVRAFGAGRGWGFATLFVPPAGLAFTVTHFRRAVFPVLLCLAGLAVMAVPVIAARTGLTVDLGERVKIVDGERHVTLTGWDRTDYSILAKLPDTVVLQMANPDVTDATLDHLSGMPTLRELDVKDTQITDAGADTLAALPGLTIVRIARTKVTPDGVAKLLAKPGLTQIDVRGLGVPAKALREWKNAAPDQRKYLN